VALVLSAAAVWPTTSRAAETPLMPSHVETNSHLVSPTGATTTPRQMWVWHPGDPRALIALSQQQRVSRLLVWVSPGFSLDQPLLKQLRQLRKLAGEAGISVDALSGDPSWATKPLVVSRWAREVRDSGLFERLHLDIEPHGRVDWTDNRSKFAGGLLSALVAAKKAGLPVDADIPCWYDTVRTPAGDPLDLEVMRLADSVTLMAYRDTPAAVLTFAATGMARAASLGKPAWIGINTASPGGDPDYTSFLGKPARVIARDIRILDLKGRRWSSFAGLSLHDSESLAALR
jgi:hypothetical protein